ncbi:hypothetical protein HY620_03555 [Candidatus Uhrbacteria bacterium]|nr:hypothetical protein [Candidatus Uhrbacteria bacterium]
MKNLFNNNFIGHIIYDIFLLSFFGYLGIFFVEGIRRGIVVQFVNVDYLLMVCGLTGLTSLFFETPKAHTNSRLRLAILCLFIAALVSFGIYGHVGQKSLFAILFAFACGLIIFLASYLVLIDIKDANR